MFDMMNLKDLSILWQKVESHLWIYLITSIFLYIIYLQRNYFRLVKVVLGLKRLPIAPQMNNIHHVFDPEFGNIITPMYAHGWDMTKLWVSIIPLIFIMKPESIQKVLSGSKHMEKPYLYSLFSNLLGKGLSTSKGETYKLHAKILQKAFTSSRLTKLNKIFVEHAVCFVSSLRDNVNQDINITKHINDLIYTIQADVILNLKSNKKNNENHETSFFPYKENTSNGYYRLKRPWLLIDSIYKLTNQWKIEEEQVKKNYKYCYNIIKKIEESKHLKDDSDSITNDEKEKLTKEKVSLIEYLIDIKHKYPNFNDNDILDEVGTFMLAGLETVSTATAFCLYQLANNLECQKKCVQELNEIFDDCGTITTMDSIQKMKYLEMCIKETLRLYPPIPILSRVLSEDTEIDGKTLPPGTCVLLSPYLTHRIPNIYPDPKSFKPERFEQENYEKLHPYAYIPFSAGTRKCIGSKFVILEIKAILSTILRNFILEPAPSKGSFQLRFSLLLRAKGGIWIKFRPREDMKH